MTPNVEASCPMCGLVTVPADLFALTINAVYESESTYSFPCPGCRVAVTKPATERTVRLLMSAGVRPRIVGRLPDRTPPVGPPLDVEDLRDFVAALRSTDYLADLVGA